MLDLDEELIDLPIDAGVEEDGWEPSRESNPSSPSLKKSTHFSLKMPK